MLDQRATDSPPRVGWGDAYLLNVCAVVEHSAEEIGNWSVVIVDRDPGPSRRPKGLKLLDPQRLTHACHPDCRKGLSGVSLDRAQ
jgi:hypothetical protein